MKIGVVCYPTFGGSGVVATELGIQMAKKGHEVHFITYSQPVRLDILEPNIYYHEVNVHDYPLFEYQPYELALSSKMVDTVLTEGIDILHVHYAIPHAYAAYMAKKILLEKRIYIPVVTTLHGTDITLVGKNPSYKPAVTFSINKSDIVTSVSQSLKEDTLSSFVIKKDIEVVPNFVDLDLYNLDGPCIKSQIAPNGEKVISHISNMRPVKRIPDIIEIFFRIQQKEDAILLMIGEGPEREKAEQQAKDLGIYSKVKFLGKTSEIRRLLCMSDLFLLTSSTESFGLVALEAMAAKVPVISSNAGGISEVNVHGETGFLATIGDVETMAEHSLTLLQNPRLHEEFKDNAYRRAQEFSIDAVVPKYEAIYERALATIREGKENNWTT
ncbi:MAG: N-acetyl-alpha-D-glucosaminyl L-malate synthase BshA [Bacteroidetes bacterium]|nr:MAG: N-acetyl-alpha-D-glucosaminyl L-malate synthase BshA [Bacteroidota bacterium]REK52469.1 MAG: N-acetyl-alpha-D-glucosaminyl L-malate synthase BshA [Bacteroidota bacterium]